MKVVELFSGIGSQVKALNYVAERHGTTIEVLNTCEWDIHAMVAYNIIHNRTPLNENVETMSKDEIVSQLIKYSLSSSGKEQMNIKSLASFELIALKHIYSSIINNNNLVDITTVKGNSLPKEIDLLTYSFPCQDLSNVGNFHGYNKGIDRDVKSRSGLLWEIERILEERLEQNLSLPKFLLLENVTALIAERHNKNFIEWQNNLKAMGYTNEIYKLKATDFGIPQTRERIIMLSVMTNHNQFHEEAVRQVLDKFDIRNKDVQKDLKLSRHTLNSILRRDYTNPKVLAEALECQPNDTPSRVRMWNDNIKIVDENDKISTKVSTITTKQDRHPNSGNIYFNIENGKSKYRFLTPRECFMLMGFKEQDFEKLKKNNFYYREGRQFFTRDKYYRMTGNSIVVNVLEAVFEVMFKIDKII